MHKDMSLMQFTNNIFFILKNHVMKNTTREHKVQNYLHAPMLARIVDNHKPGLQVPKASLNIFVHRLLAFRKIATVLILGLMDTLVKVRLLRINTVDEEVITIINTPIHLKLHVSSFTCQHVINEWRPVQHIQIIVGPG